MYNCLSLVPDDKIKLALKLLINIDTASFILGIVFPTILDALAPLGGAVSSTRTLEEALTTTHTLSTSSCSQRQRLVHGHVLWPDEGLQGGGKLVPGVEGVQNA